MVTFDILLDIPGIEIEKIEISKEGDIIIIVKSTIKGTRCHKCGKWITKPYGYGGEIKLQHLSMWGRKTFIVLTPPRYICEDCDNNPTTTQQADWYGRKSPQTRRYEEHILLSLINSTVSDISIKEQLGYEAIMGIINRHISNAVEWSKIGTVKTLGIDEISLKKGHKDFVTIITGYADEHLAILGVIQGRKKEDVKAFLSRMPCKLRKKVKCVCTDMYDGYINAAKEVFGSKVRITVDRFHVAKLYRKGLEQVRKKEMKLLKDKLPESEHKEFKGVMWSLRKRETELTDDEKITLEALFKHIPTLGLAHALCNELTSIFDSNINKSNAKTKIQNWITSVRQSSLSCFDTFISTLDDRMEEITNYFVNRQTSGFVEGFNNKIKVIKRRCYGILNPKHLFQRIHLDVEGYALFG